MLLLKKFRDFLIYIFKETFVGFVESVEQRPQGARINPYIRPGTHIIRAVMDDNAVRSRKIARRAVIWAEWVVSIGIKFNRESIKLGGPPRSNPAHPRC